MKTVPASVHPDCAEFVTVVEELLQRRQTEATHRTQSWLHDDWGPRAWTRTEFEYTVYHSYKPMRQGRVTRPPRREVVMHIADYLNCSLEERNRLLLAADSTPAAQYLTGTKLDEALEAAKRVVQTLPLPAIIINRDWHIHHVNAHVFRLTGGHPERMKHIPPEKFNIIQLLFDPDMPLQPHLIENRASWTRMVRQTIYGFKMANLICQYEPWYQALLNQLMQLPEFEHHWQTVRVDAEFESDISVQNQPISNIVEISIQHTQRASQKARLRPLLISVGYFQFDFPQIVAFLPVDEESRLVLRDIGIPAPDEFSSP